ncbi:putative PurR-regulated permease PerM [Rhodoblastus acidophilus]|uniref:AI-2E family transporter n=1 Tax=Rhodoblastus acidophilus TaxID=1074 RepID=UPI0022241F7F|nr:AI-2E family transporter [Rhodoblastus acidophilus]MCW2283758.1 putative PurR-regulated permease PerM [Rhodoblastus acidophilus]MCW2332893.1 putative PurR-regulated permease PerM [Rhodoblastus acidophilus]
MPTTLLRLAAALIVATIVIGALYFASAVFEPVAFAFFFIAISWPMQKALQTRAPKTVALIATVVVGLVIVFTLTSLVAWGGGQIAHWLTRNFDRLQSVYAAGAQWLEQHDIFLSTLISERFNVVWVLRLSQQVALRLNSLVGFSLLVFVFLALGLLEAEAFAKNLRTVGGEVTGSRLIAAGAEIGGKLRRYMLVRAGASLLTGLTVWGFSLLIGLELAAAWGVIAFALNFIPFVGPLIATTLPALFALAQTGSWELALIVLATLSILQFLIGSYLEPLLAGKNLTISPFLVLFSVFFWGFVWGLPGTFIGVPIAIACLTLCEHFPESRAVAVLLSGKAPKEKTEGEG